MATDVRSPAAAASWSGAVPGPGRAVWAIVALGVLVRAWAVLAGWYGSDDLVLQSRAAAMPLDAAYLLGAPTGALMPAAAAIQWPLAQTAAFDYLPQAALLVLGHALLASTFAVLALQWFGRRWLVCVPVAVVAVSPLTLVAGTSWSAGLLALPASLSLALMLLGLLRWVRTADTRPLWAALGCWLLLLGFGEPVVLSPWLALAAAPALLPGAGARAALARTLRGTGAVWAVAAALTAGYLLLYLASDASPGAALPDPATAADALARGVALVVVPSALGGPLQWADLGGGAALAAPPAWWVLVCVELIIVLAAWSSAAARAARRTWAWAGAVVVLLLVWAAFTSLSAAPDGVFVQTMRGTSLAVVPVALALGAGLAAVGPRLAMRAGDRGPAEAAAVRRSATTAVVVVLVLASLVSTARYREVLAGSGTRDYIDTARSSLAQAADGPSLVDGAVSPAVVSPLRFPYNTYSSVLGPFEDRPAFGDPTTLLRVLDDDGELRPALVEGTAAAPGPVAGCGWIVQGRADIALAAPVVDFRHVVRVGFISSGDGTARVSLQQGEVREFAVSRGLSELVITLTGGGSTLKISDLTPGVTLCTDDVRVGRPTVVEP